jgi:hypothetical protein
LTLPAQQFAKMAGSPSMLNLVARERIITDSKWDRVAQKVKVSAAMAILA